MRRSWSLGIVALGALFVVAGGCSSSGGSGGGGGEDQCNCQKGGYFPVCGVDGKTYDATCGTDCVPVTVACNGECPCNDGGATACGTLECSASEVCAVTGCGGEALPDGQVCVEPKTCLPLPSGCGPNPSCDCLLPLWSQIACGSLTYGALVCMQPCA